MKKCYLKEPNSDWCRYKVYLHDDEPIDGCKDCEHCEQGYANLEKDEKKEPEGS